MQAVTKTIRLCLMAFAWFSVTIFFLWSIGAIWHFDLLPRPIGPILAIITLVAAIVLLFRLARKSMWLTYGGTAIIVIWLVTLLQQPTHDRQWAKDQKVLTAIAIDNEDVTIENFRNCVYRSESDYDVHRSDFEFKLTDLSKVWFIVQRFSPAEGLAHVFLSFEIENEENKKRHFAVSVEIRREEDESFSPTQGLYREYELNYIFGDERDLIGVRTVMRPDDRLFMYPVNATPKQVQELFCSMADRTNQIQDRPEFYHTLLNNCMNGILRHTSQLTPEEISWFDSRIVMPGYSDRFAFERNIIGTAGQSFEDLKQASRIDQRARDHGIGSGFSEAIRNQAN